MLVDQTRTDYLALGHADDGDDKNRAEETGRRTRLRSTAPRVARGCVQLGRVGYFRHRCPAAALRANFRDPLRMFSGALPTGLRCTR